MFPNIFTDDAFSLISLTDVINSVDTVPGRAGELAFAGAGKPLATTSAAIESNGYSLSLIQTSKRGSPSEKETRTKNVLRSVSIPHVKLEDTIQASEIQDVRTLGSTDTLRGARSVIDDQITKMQQRHDLTLENLRLGALKGIVKDADDSEIVDLYDLFNIAAPTAFDFSSVFVTTQPTDPVETVRAKCQEVIRYMKRNLKAPWPSTARVWALCGDEFFDSLLGAVSVKETYSGYEKAERRLGVNYAFGVFEYGDIFWENYQGTDDGTTIGITSDECRFFVVGVPGLYVEYYAPGDFMETANTLALPRYAKVAPDLKFNRFVEVHTQQNPLPICTRPLTLVGGTLSP
jgi:hypothetical protein